MCWKVEGVVWKERDGDGRENLNEEEFSCRSVLCIYRTLLTAQKRIRTARLSSTIIAYFDEIQGERSRLGPDVVRVISCDKDSKNSSTISLAP